MSQGIACDWKHVRIPGVAVKPACDNLNVVKVFGTDDDARGGGGKFLSKTFRDDGQVLYLEYMIGKAQSSAPNEIKGLTVDVAAR